MSFLPKIKKVPYVYNFKIKLRNFKYFFKDILHLIKNGSNSKLIKMFIISFFNYKKMSFNREQVFFGKLFDHGDWFSHKVPILKKHLDNLSKDKIKEILEIGSWEGRSSCFFLKYFDKSTLTCVDTWEGSDENFVDGDPNLKIVEKNFDYNISEYKSRVIKVKKSSNNFFKDNKKKFDFIYIDGSHNYEDVLSDAKFGYDSLNIDSYMLFDDYDWKFYKDKKNPINAINYFLKIKEKKVEIIYVSSQVLIKKIA
jgi:hypothetical protein